MLIKLAFRKAHLIIKKCHNKINYKKTLIRNKAALSFWIICFRNNIKTKISRSKRKFNVKIRVTRVEKVKAKLRRRKSL